MLGLFKYHESGGIKERKQVGEIQRAYQGFAKGNFTMKLASVA